MRSTAVVAHLDHIAGDDDGGFALGRGADTGALVFKHIADGDVAVLSGEVLAASAGACCSAGTATCGCGGLI